jgi:hypothetical protein
VRKPKISGQNVDILRCAWTFTLVRQKCKISDGRLMDIIVENITNANLDIEPQDNSEALLTIGQVILHYQYYRHEKDTHNNWCVGMIIPGREVGVVNSGDSRKTSLKGVEGRFLRNWKVDSKSTASTIVEKLLEKGFSPDQRISKTECDFEPPGSYHIFIYRNSPD